MAARGTPTREDLRALIDESRGIIADLLDEPGSPIVRSHARSFLRECAKEGL